MDPATTLTDRIVVVLVEPQHPGNVGAVARAMRNMGLWRLVIVDPPCFDPERARWMAPGAHDLLADLRVVATLDEALEGVHRVIASTARHRRYQQSVWDPPRLAREVFDTPDRVTAILFGREDHGLTREQANRAQALVRIATPEHASLNLAQAVLVISHALFEEARRRGHVATGRTVSGRRGAKSTRALTRGDRRDQPADVNAIEPAVTELVALLDRIGYTRSANAEKVGLTAREALQRAAPTLRQIEALRGMVRRVEWALDQPHPDADDQAPTNG